MIHLPAEEKDLVIVDLMLMAQFNYLFVGQYFDALAADAMIRLAEKWKRDHVVEAMRNKVDKSNAFKQLLAAIVKSQEMLALHITSDSTSKDADVINELLGVLDEQSLVKIVNLFNK